MPFRADLARTLPPFRRTEAGQRTTLLRPCAIHLATRPLITAGSTVTANGA